MHGTPGTHGRGWPEGPDVGGTALHQGGGWHRGRGMCGRSSGSTQPAGSSHHVQPAPPRRRMVPRIGQGHGKPPRKRWRTTDHAFRHIQTLARARDERS